MMMKKVSRIAKWGAVVGLPMLFAGMIEAQSAGNWTQQMPSTPPTSRYYHALAYDSAHGQVVLFGGQVTGGLIGSTSTWDGSNWTLTPPAIGPPPRAYHAMAYDSANKQVVLFGGAKGSAVSGDFSDTWTWDGSTWTQKSPQNSPSARSFIAMAYDSTHGQVVLFGGTKGYGKVGDTWVWDGSNWTEKFPLNSPPARFAPTMAYDSAHGQVVLFGGSNDAGGFNDTWVWDGSNWTQKSPQSSPFGGIIAYD